MLLLGGFRAQLLRVKERSDSGAITMGRAKAGGGTATLLPSPSRLVHLTKVEGWVQQNDSLAGG